MKILKNRVFLVLVTAITFTSIGVVASQIQADSVGYKTGTVKDALDNIYNTSLVKKVCELKSGTALTVGSKYECDPGDGVKRNFYVLKVNKDEVKLIMEHNITEGTATRTMSWMNAMKYFKTGAGANVKSAWVNVQDIDLPSIQDIADAVGNTSWKLEDKTNTDCFYLDPNNGVYGSTQVANSSNLSNYRWLYNYTLECTAYGCDPETSLSEGEAYGYWTKDIIAQLSDTNGRAWVVLREGQVCSNVMPGESWRGVRPVITVLKSNLYE